MDDLRKELRQLKRRLFGQEPLDPRYLKIPGSLRNGAEPGEFCYEGGKLKIVAADGTVDSFSPD